MLFQNVSAKYPNMMKNIMQGQQNRMMAPNMIGPPQKRPKLSNQPLPGPPMGLGARGPSPGLGPGPRGPPMMGNRPMGPGGPMGGPAGMMGPNGQMGPGRPGDMNMGPMGPSGPMRPGGDMNSDSPGPINVSSSIDSPLTSCPSSMPSCSLDSPSMTTSMTMTNTTSSIGNTESSLGFNDPSTPDPSRGDGPQSPSFPDKSAMPGENLSIDTLEAIGSICKW